MECVCGHCFLRFYRPEYDGSPTCFCPNGDQNDRELPDLFLQSLLAHFAMHKVICFAKSFREIAGDRRRSKDKFWHFLMRGTDKHAVDLPVGIGESRGEAVHGTEIRKRLLEEDRKRVLVAASIALYAYRLHRENLEEVHLGGHSDFRFLFFGEGGGFM